VSYDLIPQFIGIYKAGQDLSNYQYYPVRLNSFQRWQLAAEGEDAHGILVNKPLSGQVAKVCIFGIVQAIVGEAVLPGRPLSVNADGKLIESTGGAIVAYSVDYGTNDGDIVSVAVGSRGGVNVILDAEVDEINPGETVLVDYINTAIVRSANWIVSTSDSVNNIHEMCNVNATHNTTTSSRSVYGLVKAGGDIERDIIVSINGSNMELKVKNNHTHPIRVKVLQIRTTAA
jgi:hypothetical protein